MTAIYEMVKKLFIKQQQETDEINSAKLTKALRSN